MASTFQPPIVLSAEQDDAQQAAFINQNFQNLAVVIGNILNNHSLYISEQGIATIPSTSHATGSISFNDVTVTFTETYSVAPIVLSFIVSGYLIIGSVGGFWGTDAFVPQSYGGTPIAFTMGYIPRQIVTTTQVVFREEFINSTGSNQVNSGFGIQYYVIPQT